MTATLNHLPDSSTEVEEDASARRLTPRQGGGVAFQSQQDVPRSISRRTRDDLLTAWGAAVGSFALVWLTFYQLLPTDGKLGFAGCWAATFSLFLGVLTGMSDHGPQVRDRIASAVIHLAAGIVGIALLSAIVFTFYRGYPALHHLNFFTQDGKGIGPLTPLTRGGITHAIVGSLIELGIAVIFCLPLGVGTAVYMTEVGGRLARVVRTIVEAMTALPSIVAGLFVYTIWIVDTHHTRTAFAASLAISVMILPIIARAADVVLRVVPGGLREASLALGASRWQTVRRVVLPTARPGLATALILGIARGVGETSPVLLTSGVSTFFNANPLKDPTNSLPLYVYTSVKSGSTITIERGFGAASVLLALVLILFVITRLLARQRTAR